MQRAKHSAVPVSSPTSSQSKSKVVLPKSELATFYGIGTEEIRKSIETLDRILDQYDSGSSSKEGRMPDRKFASALKADPAAQILASCMKTAGTHKLRKRPDEELPPPPPELLAECSQSYTATAAAQHTMSMTTDQLHRTKCPPLVPKRGPETKLSGSLPSETSSVSSLTSRDFTDNCDIIASCNTGGSSSSINSISMGSATSLVRCSGGSDAGVVGTRHSFREESNRFNSSANSGGFSPRPVHEPNIPAKRQAESGYVSPEQQQELIESIFSNCMQQQPQHWNTSSSQFSNKVSEAVTSVGQLPDSRNVNLMSDSSAVANKTYLHLDSGISVDADDVFDSSGCGGFQGSVNGRIGSSAALRTQSNSSSVDAHEVHLSAHLSDVQQQQTSKSVIIESASASLAPYLACIVPPPPTDSSSFTGSNGLIDPSSLIVPPPPPPDLIPQNSLKTAAASFDAVDLHYAASAPTFTSPSSAESGYTSTEPSAKLPPPPTFPKQSKNPPVQPDSSPTSYASPLSAFRCKPASSKLVFPDVILHNNSNRDDTDFFPPPPPNLSEISYTGGSPNHCMSRASCKSAVLPPPPVAPKSGVTSAYDITSSESSPFGGNLHSVSLRDGKILSPLQQKSLDEQDGRVDTVSSRVSLLDQFHAGKQQQQQQPVAMRSMPNSASLELHSFDPVEQGVHDSPHVRSVASPSGNGMHSSSSFEKSFDNAMSLASPDLTRIPGYQEIPPNCPLWKKALIEKKNKQLEEEAMKDFLARKREEERWIGIPDWKKSLIMEKEKKKQEEMVPCQVDDQKRVCDEERMQSLPEWKRNLVLKKRGSE